MTQVDRRAFLQKAGIAGAATAGIWAAPSVLGSHFVAAAGSGPCGTLPSLAFVPGIKVKQKTDNTGNGGNGAGVSSTASANNNWIFTASHMTGSDLLGVFSNYGDSQDRFVVERNPAVPLVGPWVTYAHTLGSLFGGNTYSFAFSTYNRDVNQYTELMAVQVVKGTVVTTLATYTTGGAGSGQTALTPDGAVQNWTVSFTPPAGGGIYTFQYVFSFTDPSSGNGVGDDIGVTAPVISCHA